MAYKGVALGIHPEATILGSSVVSERILLRAKVKGKTVRYISCHDSNNLFIYFRKVTSSERKRVGKGTYTPSLLEKLCWKETYWGWEAQLSDLQIQTLSVYTTKQNKAPIDFNTYVVNGALHSKQKLEGLVKTHESYYHS